MKQRNYIITPSLIERTVKHFGGFLVGIDGNEAHIDVRGVSTTLELPDEWQCEDRDSVLPLIARHVTKLVHQPAPKIIQ